MKLTQITTVTLTTTRAMLSRSGRVLEYTDLAALRQMIMDAPNEFVSGDLADFRRAADNVRLAQLGVMLCASDCGEPSWSADGTALIGLNGDGCAQNNRAYWDDYVSHGREQGRASLFVPTLPSIPVCEAAITLGIHGPVRYIACERTAQAVEQELVAIAEADETVRQIMTVEIQNGSATICLYRV